MADCSAAKSADDYMSDVESDRTEAEPVFHLTLQLHGKSVEVPFYDDDATIQDLSDAVFEELGIQPQTQKFLITPKTGLLKTPFKNPTLLLRDLRDKKIVLMGATAVEVDELGRHSALQKARMERRRNAQQAGRRVKPYKSVDWKKAQAESKYTFLDIKPLPYLPNPEKSLRFLQRLANDAGIKASMRSHGFAVGLLTEMNPAEHTTHESRTLGLNRNRGQVIELRLRTDAYDGYRDYKVIRKTLCHELAHNVWGEHDSNFWALCREIEAEVDRNDFRRGGNSVAGEEFYNPNDTDVDEHADAGGWTGGEFRLGSGPEGPSAAPEPMTRREIMARAAETRAKRLTETRQPSPPPPSPPAEAKGKGNGKTKP